jgi:hypothetical protein
MSNAIYRDLVASGLTLVTPTDAAFASMVRDIESRPQPFGSWPIEDLNSAEVLLNQSRKATRFVQGHVGLRWLIEDNITHIKTILLDMAAALSISAAKP